MSQTEVMPSISGMHAGDHYCGIFRTNDDHRALTIDFVRDGVRRREKMFYLVNIHTSEQLWNMLAEAGIDVEPLVRSGQLVLLTAKDTYLRDGLFDPDRMIALLGEATDAALAEGYAAMRATGEMTWALAGEPGSERLVEYESRLNDFFPDRKCYAVCQYDRRRFDPEMLVDIVCSHPKVLYGRDAFDNSRMYYVPPESFLGGDRTAAILDRWLENLSVASQPAKH